MRIGILTCGHVPDMLQPRHGDMDVLFQDLLHGHGFSFRIWDVEGMAFPASPTECDGWLLTGSKHGVYEDHAFIPPLEAFVREAYATDVPLTGICFGHQLVAQAMGGKVTKYEGGWALGRRQYQVDGLGEVTLNAWHQDQVVEVPEGAHVIATNAFTKAAGLAFDDRILTLQPHPELHSAIIADYGRTRRGMPGYPDAQIAQVIADDETPTDAPRVADWLAAFYKSHASNRAARRAAARTDQTPSPQKVTHG